MRVQSLLRPKMCEMTLRRLGLVDRSQARGSPARSGAMQWLLPGGMTVADARGPGAAVIGAAADGAAVPTTAGKLLLGWGLLATAAAAAALWLCWTSTDSGSEQPDLIAGEGGREGSM